MGSAPVESSPLASPSLGAAADPADVAALALAGRALGDLAGLFAVVLGLALALAFGLGLGLGFGEALARVGLAVAVTAESSTDTAVELETAL